MENNLLQNQQNKPVSEINKLFNNQGIKQMFESALKENAPSFIASIIDLYGSDTTLQQCNPTEVIMEALKAASLNLPINKSLGFSWIVPYGKSKKNPQTGKWEKEYHPAFQIGYKGYIQLAMRTGQYITLNSDLVYEGEKVEKNRITGQIKITGEPTSDIPIGYFCFFRLINGFEKILYLTKEEIIKHASKHSQGYQAMIKAKNDPNPRYPYKSDNYVWDVDFDAMALKTVTTRLISKYGTMSTQLQKAQMDDVDISLDDTMSLEANQLPIAETPVLGAVIDIDPVTGEVLEDDKSDTVNTDVQAPF